MSESLYPDIPLEIRGCRIGSCVNSLTRTLSPYAVTFDPQKLSGANLLRFISGTGELLCHANSSASSFAESSMFALDAKAKARFLGCTASAGFNMALASKSTSSNQGINCYVSYTYKGQVIQLLYQGATPQTLYNCMTEDFKKCYEELMNAVATEDFKQKYKAFTNRYGHGCVTALHLTAGSAIKFNLHYSDDTHANSAKYGASISVNTPYGGGSVAGQWASEAGQAEATATMELIGKDVPEGAPTAGWCRDIIGKFASKGIDILVKGAGEISAPAIEPPKAPDIPDPKEPDKEKKPARQNTDPELSKELQKEVMKEDGYDDWDKYLEAQKKAYDQLTAKNIVADANQVVLPKTAEFAAAQRAQSPLRGGADAKSVAALYDSWDLGGYIPYAYEVTPWSVLFPDLLLKLPQAFASIYFAKMYMYYFTRLQLSQYLYFVADADTNLPMHPGITADAIRYADYCSELRDDIAALTTIDDDVYKHQVDSFNKKISGDPKFGGKYLCDSFQKNYRYFADSPYGFILVQGGQYFSVKPDQTLITKDVPRPMRVDAILADALRFYPLILSGDDGDMFLLACFRNGHWEKGFVCHFSELTVCDDKGCAYVTQKGQPESRFYFVGFDDIPRPTPDGAEFSVRGLPMFDDFSFDEMKEFARPSEG